MTNTRNMLPSPPPIAPTLWENGLDDLTIRSGDLWVTSWDGDDLAVVLIVKTYATHVTVWLVTDETDTTPAGPSFRLTTDWLDRTLACWPEAQAGMSKALLSRRLGNALSDREIRSVFADVWEPDEELNASVAYYPDTRSDEADDALDHACRYAAMLSDLDTPHAATQPFGVLSAQFKAEHDLSSPRTLAPYLAGVPALVVSAFNAERLLKPEEIAALADAYDTAPSELVEHPQDATVTALRNPKWKPAVNRVMTARSVHETEARLLAWDRVKIPARQTRAAEDDVLDARIEHAFNELLAD